MKRLNHGPLVGLWVTIIDLFLSLRVEAPDPCGVVWIMLEKKVRVFLMVFHCIVVEFLPGSKDL